MLCVDYMSVTLGGNTNCVTLEILLARVCYPQFLDVLPLLTCLSHTDKRKTSWSGARMGLYSDCHICRKGLGF